MLRGTPPNLGLGDNPGFLARGEPCHEAVQSALGRFAASGGGVCFA